MRLLLIAAALAALAANPVLAKDSTTGSDKMKACAASWNAMSAAEKKATTHNAYTSKCMKGSAATASNKTAMSTPAPASTNKSAMSANSAGKPASARTSKATTVSSANSPQGATARCKDGSYSHAANHTGACSDHGGVANWIK